MCGGEGATGRWGWVRHGQNATAAARLLWCFGSKRIKGQSGSWIYAVRMYLYRMKEEWSDRDEVNTVVYALEILKRSLN